MKFQLLFSILLTLITKGYATNGIDIATPVSTDDFQCMVSQGYTYAIIRGYRSYGAIDQNAQQTLTNARQAGMSTDTYHFPCLSQSAMMQAQALVNYIQGLYNIVWIDVESNPSTSCAWSTTDFQSNCDFLTNLVQAYQSLNQTVGIYASKYQWQQIFGGSMNCANFYQLPLWYPHYNDIPSFSDWDQYAFGNWTGPTMKQYSDSGSMCNQDGVDLDWEPNDDDNSDNQLY